MDARQVLIVSSSEKGTEFFKRCLDGSFVADFAESSNEARRRLAEKDYDIVVINCPLKDEFGTELAEEAAKSSYSGVLAVVREDVYDQVAYDGMRTGILCLPKPVTAQAFLHGLWYAAATNRRMKGLIAKTESLKEKMEEIKLVGRAKLLLISKLSLSESEAHRYIEKQAMDRGEKRVVIAMEIIKTYQN